MKLISLKTLVFASSAFCAAAAFAANQARVDVPFDFIAKGQSYPAGIYEVALDEQGGMVRMESQMLPGKQISWLAGPADSRKGTAVVVFDQAGSDHTLKTIQVGSRITPNLDVASKRSISATTSIAGQ